MTRYEAARMLGGLDAMAEAAVADRVISRAEQLQWLASMIRAERLGYFHISMLLFTVVGVVPPAAAASATR